ncbi:MAG: hypothetical protein H7338_09625 [Candidatus Sericytochromatia bacterium]|nr:hypothetical protein [Candidatus Sericytochromatia bacterium]
MLRTIALTLMTLIATTLVGCGATPMIAAGPTEPAAALAKAPQGDRVLVFATMELKKFDSNRDGFLSQAEYVAARFADLRFVTAPTAAETATIKAGLAKKFTGMDLNRDKKLTPVEFRADFV